MRGCEGLLGIRGDRSLRFRNTQWLAFLIAVSFSVSIARGEDDRERCLKCHGDPKIGTMRPESLMAMVRIPEGQSPVLRSASDTLRLYAPEKDFASTAHGGLSCTTCHLGIERLPHDQRLATMKCQDCHADVEKEISAGPHGGEVKSGRAKPGCQDCHGPSHQIAAVRFPRDTEQAKALVRRCAACHEKGGPGNQNHIQSYKENVHGQALFVKGLGVTAICTDCHGTHAVLPVSDPESPMSPLRAPATCGKCHEGIERVYFTSIHGQHTLKGEKGAASCTSCHSSHGIRAVSRGFLKSVVDECSHCHAKLGETYLTSYHGKVTQLGDESAAVCSSCHGAHDILPLSDPNSRLAPRNRAKTCGQCHHNTNKNFVKYVAHMNVLDWRKQPQIFITWLGMTVLLLSVLVFFIIHTILWFQRSFVEGLRHKGAVIPRHPENERMFERFRPIHRFTHALIIISFMGLVATGFPLKYSYTEWAKELTVLFGGVRTMGIVHRCLAIVTFGYVAIHAAFLVHFFRKHCPKPRMRFLFGPDSMLFNMRDLKDFIAMVRWFFWLGPRPSFERWTYFEKFDYFGEIWGVFLIGGTGLILWVPTLFTRWLPGWVLNCATVIHSIEALLAASVIFLVHFFNTHLRPGKFPIDMVMLTGQMPESEMIEERGLEYARLKAAGKLEERIVKAIPRRWRTAGAVLGIAAFLFGMVLIALALSTELAKIM